MQHHEFQPLVEAFLLVERPRQRLVHWTTALGALDSDAAPPLATVTAYYDPTLDQALLGLRYDDLALGPERLAYIVEVALLAEIGMIQPAELSDGDRRRFLGERLARCTVQVGDQRNVVNALTELVRRVREQRAGVGKLVAAAQPPPLPRIARPSRPAARPSTEEPLLLVQPRGTRDDLGKVVREQPDPPAPPRTDLPRAARRDEHVRTTSPHVVRPASVHHAETEELPLVGARAPGAEEGMPPPSGARRARSPSKFSTEPYLPTTAPLPPATIYARYLRSGRWVPLRVGALSLRGAALMAGALPRVQDHVDIALTYGGHRALVRGSVAKVSSLEETAQSGTATFSVSFELDEASRRQLTELLTAARAAKVTIKPPPPRATRRYAVEWPVSLGTARGAVRADALDVSREGMFVRPVHPLAIDTNVTFSAVLEDGGPPVSGRARIVRQINDAEAKTCGLAAGYGLRLIEMAEADRERWMAFLARIERRAEKRVLVGASPERLGELQAGLAAAGYAVTGGADQGSLVQLANTTARPVDAVLIDAAWLTPGTSASWVESLFSARNVPCVTMRGDARRARAAIDKLLAVV